jgi:16S rRNA (guanine1207-N2)-methyltransferase
LIEAIDEFPAERVLCTSLGRAQFAWQYAERFAESRVTGLFLDTYQTRRAETAAEVVPANLRFLCAADPPQEEFDLAAMPFTQGGEAELTRDLMQSAHQTLRPGGHLLVAVDNRRDAWLHEEMRRLFGKVTKRAGQGGVMYVGTRREPLKKPKNFRCEFKFRDGERLISVITRPGVFSHRRLDLGARALLEVMEISPGFRVLDLGCGAGVLSLAVAMRAENVSVLSLDANARAVECTEQGAALNGINSLTAQLNATAKVDDLETFDVVLANPPYFSNYRLAEIFLKGARRALKSGGQLLVVAKTSEWYEENMPRQFSNVTVQSVRDYAVISGSKR